MLRGIIFGTTGSGKTTLSKDIIKSFDRVVIFDTLGEHTEYLSIDNGNDFYDYISKNKKFKVAYKEGDFSFDNICEIVYHQENLLFVIEEADWFCSPSYIDENFKKILRYGRHKNIQWLAISRRPHCINRLVTSQINRLYTFSQREPRDLKYIEEFTGIKVDDVTNLQKYHYIEWNAEGGDFETKTIKIQGQFKNRLEK